MAASRVQDRENAALRDEHTATQTLLDDARMALQDASAAHDALATAHAALEADRTRLEQCVSDHVARVQGLESEAEAVAERHEQQFNALRSGATTVETSLQRDLDAARGCLASGFLFGWAMSFGSRGILWLILVAQFPF